MQLRSWSEADVILFSGDAYVDHPAFGAAVIGRLLEAEGLRVAIVPQPQWHGDLRDFQRLGRPRLFFAVAPGAMDSMVNKYTAARRLRSQDAYSPGGRHDMRPEYPTIVYTQALHQLYPDVPVVVGGIEASMRRLTHYDYWKQRLCPSILVSSGADLLIYGMGELPMTELCRLLTDKLLHKPQDMVSRDDFHALLRRYPVRQTATLLPKGAHEPAKPTDVQLTSHEQCIADKREFATNFKLIERESNSLQPHRILQQVDGQQVVVYPPFPPMTTDQIDRSFSFPYTRLPHPKYKGQRIPAYDMIKFSVCLHRGCFGGCAFCTISAHQGKFIASRSEKSVLREVEQITHMPDFRGYLSDLGGPSANMYGMHGRDLSLCRRCLRPSCLHPAVCSNLQADHRPLLRLYRAVDALPGIKKSFVSSGVRYDLILHPYSDASLRRGAMDYAGELITHHVSGRLKVAPEHTSEHVLRVMRKPSFALFHQFKELFDGICRKASLPQQLVPYFISSHPGCTLQDMAMLAAEIGDMDFRLEQVQDFTPTPMTMATDAWYSGLHPYTLEPLFVARSAEDKQRQRMFFFAYKPGERALIDSELRRMGREDLIPRVLPRHVLPREEPLKGNKIYRKPKKK